MSSSRLGSSYGCNNQTNPTNLNHPQSLDDYDSDVTDVTNVEEILPVLSTPPRLTSTNLASHQTASVSSKQSTTDHGDVTPFRPRWDVPKARLHSTGFHPIRENKYQHEQMDQKFENQDETKHASVGPDSPLPASQSHIQTVGKGSIMVTKVCNDGRKKKKQACKHRKRKDDPVNTSSIRKLEGDTKPVKVQKVGPSYKKHVHDRSNGPSMTKTAIDFRQRKEVQAQYQERLAELLDDDIVKQVEGEGGITPLGRLFKASVRMLERAAEERSDRARASQAVTFDEGIDARSSEILLAEQKSNFQSASQANQKLHEMRSALRALLGPE